MSVKLIDTKATITFIAKSDEGDEKPTVFHIKPPTWRESLGLQRLFKLNIDTGKPELIGDDESWIWYIAARITKIENVMDASGQIFNATSNEEIKFVLRELPVNIGSELFAFILENTNLNETQSKN